MKIRGTLGGIPVNMDPSEGVLTDENGNPIGSFSYDGEVDTTNNTIVIDITVDSPEIVKMLTGKSVGSISFSTPMLKKEMEA